MRMLAHIAQQFLHDPVRTSLGMLRAVRREVDSAVTNSTN